MKRAAWIVAALIVVGLAVAGACKENDPPKSAPPPSPAKAPPAKAPPPAPKPQGTPPSAGAQVPAKREASKADVEKAIATLTANVTAGAHDRTNPWAMAHGLLVFGKDMKASDGRLAVDVMVSDFTVSAKSDGRKIYGFPERTASGTPVDPHGNMIVRALLAAGVNEDKKFKLGTGETITLKRLADDAEWVTAIPTNDKDWHRFAWTHGAILERHGASDAIDTKFGKKTLLELALRAVHHLEEDQQTLTRLRESGHPEQVTKDRTGIFGHPCGGLHFVQTTAEAAQQQGDENLLAKVRAQLDTVLFRWEAERRIYRNFATQRPDVRILILVQELKFYGHILETFALASEQGVVKLSADDKKRLREVAGDLLNTIEALSGAYANLDKIKASSAQTYYDLIGDGCHAIRGLREGLVPFFGADP